MMPLSTFIAVSLLLVAPVLSVPMRFSKGDNFQVRNDDLEARNPGFGNWFNDVKKFAGPAAKIASLVIRDDTNESELSARDIEDLEYLAARDPSFGSWFHKEVKKYATVNNLKKAANVASLVIREDGEVFNGVERDVVDGMALDELD